MTLKTIFFFKFSTIFLQYASKYLLPSRTIDADVLKSERCLRLAAFILIVRVHAKSNLFTLIGIPYRRLVKNQIETRCYTDFETFRARFAETNGEPLRKTNNFRTTSKNVSRGRSRTYGFDFEYKSSGVYFSIFVFGAVRRKKPMRLRLFRPIHVEMRCIDSRHRSFDRGTDCKLVMVIRLVNLYSGDLGCVDRWSLRSTTKIYENRVARFKTYKSDTGNYDCWPFACDTPSVFHYKRIRKKNRVVTSSLAIDIGVTSIGTIYMIDD